MSKLTIETIAVVDLHFEMSDFLNLQCNKINSLMFKATLSQHSIASHLYSEDKTRRLLLSYLWKVEI